MDQEKKFPLLNLLKKFGKDQKLSEIEIISSEQAISMVRSSSPEHVQNKVITVDFSKVDFFQDPNGALMCLVVLTSDGKKGSLSHLQTDVDISSFVYSLLQYHNDGVPVCLSGGEDGLSTLLIEQVTQQLEVNGFTVSRSPMRSDLLGTNIYRRATLFPDKVEITRMPYSGEESKVVLYFEVP